MTTMTMANYARLSAPARGLFTRLGGQVEPFEERSMWRLVSPNYSIQREQVWVGYRQEPTGSWHFSGDEYEWVDYKY